MNCHDLKSQMINQDRSCIPTCSLVLWPMELWNTSYLAGLLLGLGSELGHLWLSVGDCYSNDSITLSEESSTLHCYFLIF